MLPACNCASLLPACNCAPLLPACNCASLLPACRVQISKTYTHYAATALFFFFGGRMLYEAVTNAHAGENELDEVEKELEVGDTLTV